MSPASTPNPLATALLLTAFLPPSFGHSLLETEGTPTKHARRGSAKAIHPGDGPRRASVQETPIFSMAQDAGKRSSLQDGEKDPLLGTRRSSVQEGSLKPEKPKRSSAHARVSPRADKKAQSAYTTLVSKEKLDRSSRELMQWVQKTLVGTQKADITSWDAFKDGIALILLINVCDSTILNIEEFDMSDPLRTLEAAFDIAECRLGVPNLFDAKALIDARLSDNGPDLKTFLLYITHFRSIILERQRSDNPVSATLSLVADLKRLVERKVNHVELLNDEFQEHTHRLSALASQDELQAERTYLQQRALKMDKMMEWGRQLNSELEAQNLALRDQTRLLNDKIAHLSRALEQEKNEKEAALAQVAMVERIKAMAELLNEPDLDKFIEQHKEEIDLLTGEASETKASSTTPCEPTPSASATSAS